SWRNNQFRHLLPNGLGPAVAKSSLGGRIPIEDSPEVVDGNNTIEGHFQNRGGAGFARAQSRLRLLLLEMFSVRQRHCSGGVCECRPYPKTAFWANFKIFSERGLSSPQQRGKRQRCQNFSSHGFRGVAADWKVPE